MLAVTSSRPTQETLNLPGAIVDKVTLPCRLNSIKYARIYPVYCKEYQD